MTATINKFRQKNFPLFLISLIIVWAFVFSFFWYIISNKTHRRTFIFPSADTGKYIVEQRNLVRNPHQGDLQFFIEEMLLGSTVERTKLIFAPGTKLLSCFERNHVLYVNLSKELLQMGDGVAEIKEGTELFKKNIKKNFSEVHSIEIYIDGKSAFEK